MKNTKKLIPMGSIPQFREVVRNIRHMTEYAGQDENGEAIYDHSRTLPTLTITGTEKLHGCFEKNSLVTLANGEKIPISKVQSGTYILSYNENTKEIETKKVINSINRKLDKEWCKLVFDKTEIICTKDHKIFTENRGYVEASKLNSKDVVKTLI